MFYFTNNLKTAFYLTVTNNIKMGEKKVLGDKNLHSHHATLHFSEAFILLIS